MLQVAMLAGALPADVDLGVRWVSPCWEHVDPVKDVQSDVLAVDAGFKSRRQVVAEWGRDADEVAAEIAAERPAPEVAT